MNQITKLNWISNHGHSADKIILLVIILKHLHYETNWVVDYRQKDEFSKNTTTIIAFKCCKSALSKEGVRYYYWRKRWLWTEDVSTHFLVSNCQIYLLCYAIVAAQVLDQR